MKCDDAGELLELEHDGDLDAKQAAALKEHVDGCTVCSRRREELVGIKGLVAGAFEALGKGAPAEAVCSRAVADASNGGRWGLGKRAWRPVSLALAASVVLGICVWLFMPAAGGGRVLSGRVLGGTERIGGNVRCQATEPTVLAFKEDSRVLVAKGAEFAYNGGVFRLFGGSCYAAGARNGEAGRERLVVELADARIGVMEASHVFVLCSGGERQAGGIMKVIGEMLVPSAGATAVDAGPMGSGAQGSVIMVFAGHADVNCAVGQVRVKTGELLWTGDTDGVSRRIEEHVIGLEARLNRMLPPGLIPEMKRYQAAIDSYGADLERLASTAAGGTAGLRGDEEERILRQALIRDLKAAHEKTLSAMQDRRSTAERTPEWRRVKAGLAVVRKAQEEYAEAIRSLGDF